MQTLPNPVICPIPSKKNQHCLRIRRPFLPRRRIEIARRLRQDRGVHADPDSQFALLGFTCFQGTGSHYCQRRAALTGATLFLCFAGLLAVAVTELRAASLDYAAATQRDEWLRHPVYGDPSFDAFERMPGPPILRGTPPFAWPVNGFFFPDPRSGMWYVYIGEYGEGYLKPPSRCRLFRSSDQGRTWMDLGIALQGDPTSFDRGGHTPDVSVVYSEGRYHMIYDWGEPDFNLEGGLAYAWAEQPEGPWHRAIEPITRNSSLTKLAGRYQRTYAATLIRRTNDWLILGMMDHAPHSWALFAMTAQRPEGPYSERRLVRCVENDRFHPPLMEFFPAFTHQGFVYAPATSVALNRDFNAVFRAPLEQAHKLEAWVLAQYGDVWHAADTPLEHFGIWGQTYSGAVMPDGMLRALFPTRDYAGRGCIQMAARPWTQPYRKAGFVLSGHSGPALTVLRTAYAEFNLAAKLRLRGSARLLFDYRAPFGPDSLSADATLHPLMNTRHLGLELTESGWTLRKYPSTGASQEVASGTLPPNPIRNLRIANKSDRFEIAWEGRVVWSGQTGLSQGSDSLGLIGLRVEKNSYLEAISFRIKGQARTGKAFFLHTEALLGAGETSSDWEARTAEGFRFGTGSVSTISDARAKWNVIGSGIRLWSPRGPEFGIAEIRLDGEVVASVNLHAERSLASEPVWERQKISGSHHALVLTAKVGRVPLDCVEATLGNSK